MHQTESDFDLPKATWRQEMRLTRENGEVLSAVSECLLNGRLAVLLSNSVLNGELLAVDAVLPNHAAHRLEPVQMRCRVSYLVSLARHPETLRAGLAIEQIDGRNRQRLLRFAREQIQRQHARKRLRPSDHA